MKVINHYIANMRATLDQIPLDCVEAVIAVLRTARTNRKQVFIMGNGGSAATASHFACDLAKSTRQAGWPGFRVFGLTDNMATFSAYANDEGYESVFKQQLANLLQEGDVVIAISGSGNSRNVVEAVAFANQHGAITVGLTGMTGGTLKNIAHFSVYVPNYHIDQVEDIHLMIEHMVCRALAEIASVTNLPVPTVVQPEVNSVESEELVKQLFSKSLPRLSGTSTLNEDTHSSTDFLSKISHEMAAKVDLHDLLGRILCQTVDYLGAVGGSIVVLDESGEVVDAALTYGGNIQEQAPERLGETMQHGLAAWVLENRRPALVDNTREDPRWLPKGWEVNLDLSRSAICVPLLMQDRVIGVLTLTRMQSNRFTMEDLSLMTSITLALSYSFTDKSKVTGR